MSVLNSHVLPQYYTLDFSLMRSSNLLDKTGFKAY